jgi:hypothetical protein
MSTDWPYHEISISLFTFIFERFDVAANEMRTTVYLTRTVGRNQLQILRLGRPFRPQISRPHRMNALQIGLPRDLHSLYLQFRLQNNKNLHCKPCSAKWWLLLCSYTTKKERTMTVHLPGSLLELLLAIFFSWLPTWMHYRLTIMRLPQLLSPLFWDSSSSPWRDETPFGLHFERSSSPTRWDLSIPTMV